LLGDLGIWPPFFSESPLRDDLSLSGGSLPQLATAINARFFPSGHGISVDQLADCQTIGDLVDLIWHLLRRN
jgi:hypothetical protein